MALRRTKMGTVSLTYKPGTSLTVLGFRLLRCKTEITPPKLPGPHEEQMLYSKEANSVS